MSVSRAAYVSAVRGTRSAASRLGLLDRLASARSPRARHLRTLFAIYDVDDLATLDLPWWVYGAIDEVAAFLRQRDGAARVFEYGCGASTLWLARRAGQVHSVEHDGTFVATMAAKLAGLPHVSLRHVPAQRVTGRPPATPSGRFGHRDLDFTEYVDSISTVDGEFDLIVVDGRARGACLRRATDRLAADGLLLFDNSNRRRYQPALHSSPLAVQRIRGAAPCLPRRTETALLRRSATGTALADCA
jgi:predicted O-methyltransferase YrrM